MNYTEAIETLYNQAPMFQMQGSRAYKTGLDTTLELDKIFNSPHKSYITIHIAGTNGKGSCSNLLAAVLQKAGYKVGLYNSPHLVDFRERIRINGEMIPEQEVIEFVELVQPYFAELQPSFFEVTTAMAFRYFEKQQVDVAVIEVGLGGRLDCTNIISPVVSVITNISIDHTDLLGATEEEIAAEKAGVIKSGVPVIIGETQSHSAQIFIDRAANVGADIYFADQLVNVADLPDSQLKGFCQDKNRATVIQTLRVLQQLGAFNISEQHIIDGFANVCDITGLMGRWQKIGDLPTVICDTGHNEAGIEMVVQQLLQQKYDDLHVVMGVVSDKKIDKILQMLPKNAHYYFARLAIPRTLDEKVLHSKATEAGLIGDYYESVNKALKAAHEAASERDLIFVGGSNFTVAEVLENKM